MATAAGRIQYPFYLGNLSPYIENKKVRYSLYTAGVLAIAAAAINYGNTSVGITLASAGCLVEGYQIIQLAKKVKYLEMEKEIKNQKILPITARVFTLNIIWGMVMNGLSLSLLYKEGSLLLQHLDFQLPLTQIPYAWLKNAPFLLSHAASLARLGAFVIPLAIYFILRGDDFFFARGYQKYQHLYSLCYKTVDSWANSREGLTLSSIPNLLADTLNSEDIRSSFRNGINAVYPQLLLKLKALIDFITLLQSRRVTFKSIHDWIASFSNPESNFPQAQKSSSTSWERTKYAVNYLFFHTLNISLMTARLYYHPLPTAISFGLGLALPTSFQKEATIRRTWEIAPDFIGMPSDIKCRYLFERFSPAITAIAWWNIPGACLNGLYLAEDFRFYGPRFFQ